MVGLPDDRLFRHSSRGRPASNSRSSSASQRSATRVSGTVAARGIRPSPGPRARIVISGPIRTACSTTAPSQVHSSTSPSMHAAAGRAAPDARCRGASPASPRRCPHSGRPARSPRRRAAPGDVAIQPAGDDVAAADEARDERIGRAAVHLLRRADLLHAAFVHHHQPVGHRHRLGLVVRHHDGGDAAVLLQDADLARHLLAQRRHPDWTAVRRAAARADGSPARAPARRAAAGRRTAAAAGARRTPRASPGAASRRRARRSAALPMRRISSPNATLRATVRCGNSA